MENSPLSRWYSETILGFGIPSWWVFSLWTVHTDFIYRPDICIPCKPKHSPLPARSLWALWKALIQPTAKQTPALLMVQWQTVPQEDWTGTKPTRKGSQLYLLLVSPCRQDKLRTMPLPCLHPNPSFGHSNFDAWIKLQLPRTFFDGADKLGGLSMGVQCQVKNTKVEVYQLPLECPVLKYNCLRNINSRTSFVKRFLCGWRQSQRWYHRVSLPEIQESRWI